MSLDLCEDRFACGVRRFAFITLFQIFRRDFQFAEEIVIHLCTISVGVAIMRSIAIFLLDLFQIFFRLFLALYMKNISDES